MPFIRSQYCTYFSNKNVNFGIKDDADMIGFVISSHGQFGTVHQDGHRDEGLCIVFSCGFTSPIDVLLKEYIVKIRKCILFLTLFILY